MSLISLLSNNTKCSSNLQLSMPQLRDIAENETLKTISPSASINDIFKSTFKAAKKKIDIKLNPKAAEFTPSSPDVSDTHLSHTPKSNNQPSSDTHLIHTQKPYKIVSKFIPTYKPRAKYNIYIGKSETRNILSVLSEAFPTASTLYYYLDVLTAFQMNDAQMNIFKTINQPKITFINLDLHRKDTNELLYATVIPNDSCRITQSNKNNIQNAKWLWKLHEFLTMKEIFYKYDIQPNDLPKSSHKIHKLKSFLHRQEYINSNVLYNIDWSGTNIRQIGPIKKTAKANRMKIDIKTANWIRQCKHSWNDFAAIPIIVYENKDDTGFGYRIEWVKIVKINHSYVGISFYKSDSDWRLQTVYLDKMDIGNKHRLFGINPSRYTHIFDKFETSILEIKWF